MPDHPVLWTVAIVAVIVLLSLLSGPTVDDGSGTACVYTTYADCQ